MKMRRQSTATRALSGVFAESVPSIRGYRASARLRPLLARADVALLGTAPYQEVAVVGRPFFPR